MHSNRVAFVTGGASGIGREAALALARKGTSVVVADLNKDTAEQAAEEIRATGAAALALACDVSDEASLAAAFAATGETFDRLDIVVGAAGIDLHKTFAETDVAGFNRVIGINLTGNFLCIKHASPMMLKNRFGRIICLGSTSGMIGMAYPAYSASKAALLGLVRSAAREFSPNGITANLVCPGPTRTPLTDQLWRAQPDRLKRLQSLVPVGRVGEAAEIGATIAFIASEEAGFINGAEIVADGGLTSVWSTAPRAE